MSKKEEYELRSEKILQPLLEEKGFELVDLEYVKEAGNWYLRAYIDKEGGITIGDCEWVNRAWSDQMDREDFIPDAYIMEVSSPGLGRKLKKDRDFERSIGEAVDVKFYQPQELPVGKDGKKAAVREWSGILKAFTKETVTLETELGEVEIQRSDISVIKLTIDF